MMRPLGLVFVLFALGGVFEPDALEASSRAAERMRLQPGFDPYRDRAPLDCAVSGRPWVAHSADGGPWWHTCLDVPAASREVSSWR